MSALVCGMTLLPAGAASAELRQTSFVSAVLRNHCADILADVQHAAASNEVSALEIEAAMYDRGCGVVQNMRRAKELYADAVALGSNDDLAVGYADLYGSKPAQERGLARLKQAANAGNAFAAYDLYFYYDHQLWNQSDAVAFRWVSLAAHAGDVVAEADLGGVYISGVGVPRNITLGRRYLDRGVAADIPEALAVAGVSRLEGYEGVPMDRAEGLKLLRKAISQGLTRAKMTIVLNVKKSDYAQGLVTKSEIAAFAQDAAALLEPKRFYDYELAQYWYHGEDRIVPDCGQAVPLLLQEADDDHWEADYEIAFCYYNGDGIAQDVPLAMKYVKLAAQKGSPEAIAFLSSGSSDQPHNSPNSYFDRWHDYEGYHWTELHPMSGPPVGPH